MSEPAGRLHVDIGAEVSTAERNIARVTAALKAAAQSAQNSIAAIDQSTNKTNQNTAANNAAAAALDKAAKQLDRVDQAHLQSALAATGNAGKVNLLTQELGRATQGSVRYYQVATQLANAKRALTRETEALVEKQRQEATAQNAAAQFGESFKSGLMGVVGPAAAASLALGLVSKAAHELEEAFKFKAQLDETNRSIEVQLRGVRDVGAAMAEARQFANRYKITQADTASVIQSSIPILRNSKASLSDVEAVLLRMSILKPEQGIEGAAFALAELQGGQSRSLATRFNVPIGKATELKREIEGGGDAVQVMNKYLNSVGLGMEALSIRTQGASGKMKELDVEAENLKLALAGESGGTGLKILETRIDATRGLTRLLNGEWLDMTKSILKTGTEGKASIAGLINPLFGLSQVTTQITNQIFGQSEATQQHTTAVNANSAAITQNTFVTQLNRQARDDYATASHLAKEATERESLVQTVNTIKSQELAIAKQKLQAEARAAAEMLIRSGESGENAARRLATSSNDVDILTYAYYRLRSAQLAAAAPAPKVADPRDEFRRPNQQLKPEEIKAAQKAQTEASAAAAEARYRQSQAIETTRQRVIRLQKELKGLNPETAAYIDKQTELFKAREQLKSEEEAAERKREASGKRAATAQQKQLDLTERTTDALRKQKEAYLDLQLGIIDDRRKRREEDQRLRQAQKVLSNPNASAAQKAAAMDVLAEVPLLQQRRAMELAEKQSTANASLVNGRVYQSIPGSGNQTSPVNAGVPSSAASAAIAPPPMAVPASAAAGIGPVTVNLGIGVYLNSRQIAAELQVQHNDGVIVHLSDALKSALSGGISEGR